jgi:hypothetical protein
MDKQPALLDLMRSPLRPIGVVLWLFVILGAFVGLIGLSVGLYLVAAFALTPFFVIYTLVWLAETRLTGTRFQRTEKFIVWVLGAGGLAALGWVITQFSSFSK